MLQKNKKFQPHVLVVNAGSTVDFPNADPIFHNAFSNFNGQIFDIGLYPPGKSRSIIFKNPGVVRVFCNIHPTMAAIIVVTETPYYAVSNTAGQYSFADIPPGQYRLKIFNERSTAQVLAAAERTITVGPELLAIPPISLSEAGYITTPHSNKYGRPYPPAVEDPSAYTIPQ